PANREISVTSLHDALPILRGDEAVAGAPGPVGAAEPGLGDADGSAAHDDQHVADDAKEGEQPQGPGGRAPHGVPHPGREVGRRSDRKSTRLNSSHVKISYA